MTHVEQLREQARVLRALAESFTTVRIREQLILIARCSVRGVGYRTRASAARGSRAARGGVKRSTRAPLKLTSGARLWPPKWTLK